MSALDDLLYGRIDSTVYTRELARAELDQLRRDLAAAQEALKQRQNEISQHLPECGTQYRGCAPDCPKRISELESAVVQEAARQRQIEYGVSPVEKIHDAIVLEDGLIAFGTRPPECLCPYDSIYLGCPIHGDLRWRQMT